MVYDPRAEDFLDDKQFCEQRLWPLLRLAGKEFKGMEVIYNLFHIPHCVEVSPEYLVRFKGKKTGFHCANIRRADDDDGVRILRFLKSCVDGRLPTAVWTYMRSFGELVRIESGLKPKSKPLMLPTSEAQLKYGKASATLEKTFEENLAFKKDVLATAKKHDELFKDKIMAEAPKLELLGADGGKWALNLLEQKLREEKDAGRIIVDRT